MILRSDYSIQEVRSLEEWGGVKPVVSSWLREAIELREQVTEREGRAQMEDCRLMCLAIQDGPVDPADKVWVCRDARKEIKAVMLFTDEAENNPNTAEIFQIVAAPRVIFQRLQGTYMRKGAGSFLVRSLIDRCSKENKEAITLELPRTSAPFYQKLGFVYETGKPAFMILKLLNNHTKAA